MLKNPRNLLFLIPLILLATSPLWRPALSAFLAPRGGFEAAAVDPLQDDQEEHFIMDAITITMFNRGREDWIVNAERAYTGDTDREIGMEKVDAVYTGGEEERTRITSSRGMYNVDERHLVLIDDVVIVKPVSRQEMYTDLLHYYNTTKLVVCPGDVELRGPEFTIRAGRLDYDMLTDNYDFGGRVKVTTNDGGRS
ncbi:MAG: LPS export ABC transporter periplasmic protein LptC [Desulfobulbaceae bacterium]|jgi:LPS export ABC transporter protein LptC|nr:LPS export ABC transporter periplasmic protein LptC [Desulfobulbaceae bacterium]